MFSNNLDSLRPQSGPDGKDLQNREHFYGTVRKSCQQSPPESVAGLERIPEYSEDIYPYATFHLPEHENQAGNIPLSYTGSSSKHDSRCGDDNTLCSSGMKGKRSTSTSANGRSSSTNLTNVIVGSPDKSNHLNTEKRHKRRSKIIKSESEEYDSLNSDSEISGERIRDDNRSGRETSTFIENEGLTGIFHSALLDYIVLKYMYFAVHAKKIRSGGGNSADMTTVFSRPQLHSKLVPIRILPYQTSY